jgi:hypothetical protein
MAAGISSRLPTNADRNWFIAQRWQAYDAEARVNLLRIIAIGAFYLVHLWSYFSSQGKLPQFGFWQLGAGDTISTSDFRDFGQGTGFYTLNVDAGELTSTQPGGGWY